MFQRGQTRLTSVLSAMLLAGVLVAKAGGPGDDKGGNGELKFYGIVESMPAGGGAGDWRISQRTVHATSQTVLRGSATTGGCVEVQGSAQADNSVNASKIATEDAGMCTTGGTPTADQPSFYGTVQALPATGLLGSWQVGGKTVLVSNSTRVRQNKGPLSIGSCVEVTGPANPDGSITATDVKAESGSGGCSSSSSSVKTEVDFFGVVQSFPSAGSQVLYVGDWQVGGRIVRVSAPAQVEIRDVQVAVGACVRVKGTTASDGSITAAKLRIDDAWACRLGVSDAPKFIGSLQSLPASGFTGDWTVGGKIIHVASGVPVEARWGAVVAGACIEVRGQTGADGSITATGIETENPLHCTAIGTAGGRFELEAIIDSLPAGGTVGDWKVGGRSVRVGTATVLETQHGAVVPGACVEVHGVADQSGLLVASRVEVRSTSGTCLLRNGIINAASLSAGSVSPGQIVSIFGVNVGTPDDHGSHVEADDRLARQMGNVRVLFDGVPAPLLFTSSGQVNAVVPYSVHGKEWTEVQIENNDSWSNKMVLPVTAAAPALFTTTQNGRGQAAVLNFEAERGYTVNGAGNPGRRGSFLILYATGHGQTDPAGDDGRMIRSTLPRPLLPVRVRIGEREIEPSYHGAAPDMVSGVMQVNVRIPDDAPTGDDVPIVVTVGDHRSQDRVTVSIR